MNTKALVVAGLLAISAVALPQSASTQTDTRDEYLIEVAYTGGILVTLCELQRMGTISTSEVKIANKFLLDGLGADPSAVRLAVKQVLTEPEFKNCPIQPY